MIFYKSCLMLQMFYVCYMTMTVLQRQRWHQLLHKVTKIKEITKNQKIKLVCDIKHNTAN